MLCTLLPSIQGITIVYPVYFTTLVSSSEIIRCQILQDDAGGKDLDFSEGTAPVFAWRDRKNVGIPGRLRSLLFSFEEDIFKMESDRLPNPFGDVPFFK
jgi:hypothetical protein